MSKSQEAGICITRLSDELKLKSSYVQTWADTAQAFDIITCQNGMYRLTPGFSDLLANDSNTQYQGEMIQILVDHLSRDMKLQAEYMKTGASLTFSDHDPEMVRLISQRGALRAKSFTENYLRKNQEYERLFHECDLHICDIGCGSGAFIKALSRSFPKLKFTGIDADKNSIDLATSDQELGNVDFIFQHIEKVDCASKFDIIFMILTLHEIAPESRTQVLSNCHKWLRTGGKIFVMEFPFPENEKEVSDSRFQMGIIDQYFEMIWGSKHIGWSTQRTLLHEAGFMNIERTFLSDNTYMVISGDKT